MYLSNLFLGGALCAGLALSGAASGGVSSAAHADDAPPPISVDAVTDTAGFAVAPGGTDTVRFTLQNASQTPADMTAQWEVVDGNGKSLSVRREPLALLAGVTRAVPFVFAAKNLSTGEYGVRLSLENAADKRVLLRYEQPIAVAGPRDAFILFDKQPITRGIDFDRASLSPALMTVDGVQHWAWQGGDARGADTFWHALVLKMTDARFAGGKSPAVDVSVRYRHTPDAPVNLVADTAAGSRQIADGWGRQENWQTIYTQVDDAKFARTDYHSDPKERKSDGWDLRFNSCNTPVEIRSIFVHGYDLDNAPDYSRLLRFTSLDMGRELYIVRPGEKLKLLLNLRNLSHVAFAADYTVSLSDDLGTPLWTRSAAASVGTGAFFVPIPFDAAGLKMGQYKLALSLGRRGKNGQRQELLVPSVNLLVSDDAPLPKAQPGEFLYGCDAGVGYEDDRWMQWLDFMGVDITRGNGANDNVADWQAAFAAYDRHRIQNFVFWNVPYDRDPAALAKKVADSAAAAEAAARKFGDRAHYWELGNEPDLTFFYPDITVYEQSMVPIARAIKRGNPHAVVMNGGLANGGGPEAHPNTAKFLKLVPADALDAIAYHGHGPLVHAERNAYNNIRAMLVEDGKGQLPQIETESGLSAHTPAQMRVQARTAVEKVVFAQSVRAPTLLWFRLFIGGGDGDYTNTLNIHEARSAVLSYRAMAKTLKSLAFVRALDTGTPDTEAYLFAQKNGARRALVVWANDHAGGTATFRLGTAGITNGKQIDLFDNALARPDAAGGIASLPVELDPVYLSWNDPAAPDTVALLPSPLSAPQTVTVSPGKDTATVRVRNAGTAPLDAVLSIRATPATGVTLARASVPVRVAPGETQTVTLPLSVAVENRVITFPHRWTVFAPVPTGSVAVGDYKTDIPTRIAAKGAPILPQTATLVSDRLDLAPLGGGVGEKKEALLFATVDSPAAQTVRIGSSADWWEQWYVNGAPVFDTLASGNAGPQGVLEHAFTATLKPGRNLLAVRVLSGSDGWKLFAGGPAEIARARGAADGGGLTLELRSKGALLARTRSVVARRAVLAPPAPAWDAPGADWERAAPDGTLAEAGIVNEWAKQPDASRWWHGADDLSGSIYLRADAESLYVVAAIRDDVYRPGQGAAGIESGDSLRVAFAGTGGNVLQLGVPAGGEIYSRQAPGSAWMPFAGASVAVERTDMITYYKIKIARDLLPGTRLAVNVLANDDDGFGHKQSGAWFAGMDDPAATGGWWQCEIR